jgi:DNA-binding MarR family transcriptional regulator
MLLLTGDQPANPKRLGIFAGTLCSRGGFQESNMANSERPSLSKSEVSKTVTLTERDLRDVARLFRLLADPAMLGSAFPALVAGDQPEPAPERQRLLAKAQLVLSSRRAREQYFDRDLFGEPAWDILLALYVTEDAGARFTVSKLAECIGTPLSTAVRWVNALEEKSLIGRIGHPTDRRIMFVQLLDKGRSALDSYLGTLPG